MFFKKDDDDFFSAGLNLKSGRLHSDEKKYDIYKRFSDVIDDVLSSYPSKIGNYYRHTVYLSPKDYNNLINGLPKKLAIYTFNKKKEKIPAVMYLTKNQLKDFFITEYGGNQPYFYLTLPSKQISKTLSVIQDINYDIKITLEKLENAKANLKISRKKDYDKFINDIFKYSSKTPMLENRKKKVGKVIKSLLDKTKKVGKYHQAFVRLNSQQIYSFLEKCVKGKTKGDFVISYYRKENWNLFFPFVLYLTATQKRFYEMWVGYKNFDLILTNEQFHKTCFASVLLNRDIYYYTKYEYFSPTPKIKKITTPLAIEMRNLIDFDETPTTNKPVSSTKTKENLIPTTSKPVSSTKTKENLIPTTNKPVSSTKTKENLIPTTSKPVPKNQKIDELIN